MHGQYPASWRALSLLLIAAVCAAQTPSPSGVKQPGSADCATPKPVSGVHDQYVPATSGLCLGLTAKYFADHQADTYPNTTAAVPTYGKFEKALVKDGLTGLPSSLVSNFAATFTGSLWVPEAGNYTFQLTSVQDAQLWVGPHVLIDQKGSGSSAAVGQGKYEATEAGFVSVGVNYLTHLSASASEIILEWKGANITSFQPTTGFAHPCDAFTACSPASAPVGSPAKGSAGVESFGPRSYLPVANVTFLASYPNLSPYNPVLDTIIYFTRAAVANAAGVTLESVIITPTAAANGGIEMSVAAIFTDGQLAQTLQGQLNEQPATIFGSSPVLRSIFPVEVSAATLNEYSTPPAPGAPSVPPPRRATAAPRPPVTIVELNQAGAVLPPAATEAPAPEAAPQAAPGAPALAPDAPGTTVGPVVDAPNEAPVAAIIAAPQAPAAAPEQSSAEAEAPAAAPTGSPTEEAAAAGAEAPAPLAAAPVLVSGGVPLPPAYGSEAPMMAPLAAPAAGSSSRVRSPAAAPSLLPAVLPPAYSALAPNAGFRYGVELVDVAVPPVSARAGRPLMYRGGSERIRFGKAPALYLPIFEVVPPVPGPSGAPGIDELAYFAPIAPGPTAYSALPIMDLPAPPPPPSSAVFGAVAPAPAPGPAPSARLLPRVDLRGQYTPFNLYPIEGSYGTAQGPVPVYAAPDDLAMPAVAPATAPEVAAVAKLAPMFADAPGPAAGLFRSGLVQPYGVSVAMSPYPAPPSPPPAPPSPPPTPVCACTPVVRSTPATVKVEVLSTAYNSTMSQAINFNAYLTFSHPTDSLEPSQLRVFTRQANPNTGDIIEEDGSITSLQQVSTNCALYSVRGFVNQSAPFVNANTDIYIAVGGNVLDACGTPFNTTVVEVSQPHRLEGDLALRDVIYTPQDGVVIEGTSADIAAVFTLPVPDLEDSMFSVSGPMTYNLTNFKAENAEFTSFTFSVTVPERFFGQATVFVNEFGADYLAEGHPAAATPMPLVFEKATQAQQPVLGRRMLH